MMPKVKKQKPKIKYIQSKIPDRERQEKLDEAFNILFEEVEKKMD